MCEYVGDVCGKKPSDSFKEKLTYSKPYTDLGKKWKTDVRLFLDKFLQC